MTRNAKNLQQKSRSHRITQTGPSTFSVTSGASGNEYQIALTEHGATCTCTWSQYRPTSDRRSGCSHTVAVYNFIAGESGRKVSAWGSQEAAQRQHRPTLNIGDDLILTSRLSL